MKTKLSLALLASVGLAASAFGATGNFQANDILVGFYANGGQGADTEVVIDLGSYTQFFSGNGSTTNLSLFNTADLVSTYGANWYDRTDLTWGAIGSTKKTATLSTEANYAGAFASKDTLFSTANNGFGNTSFQANAVSDIAGLWNNGIINGTPGVGSTTWIQASASSTGSSYTFQKDAHANVDFNYFVDGTIGLNLLPGATGSVTQDLFETIPSGVTGTTGGIYNLGTFTLTSTGLSFTQFSAVPEPSTYAAIAGVLMLGFAGIRRRFSGKQSVG